MGSLAVRAELTFDCHRHDSHPKTFGSDKVLGSVVVPNVWESITPGGGPKTLELPLTGSSGSIHVTLSVSLSLPARARRATSSTQADAPPLSHSSPRTALSSTRLILIRGPSLGL